MASILIIGVGSTGLAAMERAQQFYYEFTKKCSPGANSAFMYLETQSGRKPEVTPNGQTDITPCFLCPNNITATLTNWGKNSKKEWNWLPSNADVLNSHSGAGGLPAYGRVALWDQEANVRQTINNLYSKINGDKTTNIYIVGSLTGGTGTGIFLDIAYMVRQCTRNNNIYGMFMLPNRSDVGNVSMNAIYENAYSSLRSLDKFSKIAKNTKTNSNYTCVLPSGTDISNNSAPFYNVQFFTQDFSDASASLGDLSQLVQSVGFNLVLRMLDISNQKAPFQDLVNARLVDYTTNNCTDGIFTTIGMNVFQYPESLLEEYLTTKLLVERMLNRWADPNNYLDMNGEATITTIATRIQSEALRFVHEAIENSVTQCMGHSFLGKSTFEAALDEEIGTILSGSYQAPSEKNYIYSLYDANNQAANKFYAAIVGQATTLRDCMIVAIADKIKEVSTQYQNLQIVGKWLTEIADALKLVKKDWGNRLGIDGTPSKWNICWSSLLRERLSGKYIYAITGTRYDWYKEALGGVAIRCYYNVFIPMLQQIENAMLNQNGSHELTSVGGIHLPSQDDLKQITNKVSKLLDKQDNQSIVSRMNALKGQMTGNSNSQIHFLFNGNNFDADIKVAEGKYQNGGKALTYADISHDHLWQFLFEHDIVALKSQMISSAMGIIQKMNLFANTDIVQNMMHLQPSHSAYNKVHNILTGTENNIRKDVPAMVSLVNTEQFVNHQCLKLIIASPLASTDTAGIVAQMQNFKPSADSSNFVQLPSMKNTIVVYQEYGYLGVNNGMPKVFNPLLHLSYQQQVLKSIQSQDEKGNYNASTRLAYIDKQTLVDTSNIQIK